MSSELPSSNRHLSFSNPTTAPTGMEVSPKQKNTPNSNSNVMNASMETVSDKCLPSIDMIGVHLELETALSTVIHRAATYYAMGVSEVHVLRSISGISQHEYFDTVQSEISHYKYWQYGAGSHANY